MRKKSNIILLIGCITLAIFIGVLPGYFTMGEIENWHSKLNKPSINPPNYLFGPVWTLLFTLMGITLYRIIQSAHGKWRSKALFLFALQFLLNFLWTFIFFKFHQMELAFLEIVLLWIAISLLIIHLKMQDKWSAWINIPYLLWITFASILNFAFIINN